MFEHRITGWPWERGIEPDAINENGELYIESYYTKELRTDKKTKEIIKGLKDMFVALMHWKDGEIDWLIMDNVGVLYATKVLEEMFVRCDVYNLTMR